MKLFAILAAALSVMSASAQTTAPTAPTDFPVPRLSPDTTLYGYEIRIKAYHDANTERSSYDFKESHMIIPYIFQEAYGFNQKVGLARVVLDGKYGFIEKGGSFVIMPVYEEATEFYSEELEANISACLKKNGKWGAVNRLGDIMVPFKYDYLSYIRDGWYECAIGDKWGYVNNTGRFETTIPETTIDIP